MGTLERDAKESWESLGKAQEEKRVAELRVVGGGRIISEGIARSDIRLRWSYIGRLLIRIVVSCLRVATLGDEKQGKNLLHK